MVQAHAAEKKQLTDQVARQDELLKKQKGHSDEIMKEIIQITTQEKDR